MGQRYIFNAWRPLRAFLGGGRVGPEQGREPRWSHALTEKDVLSQAMTKAPPQRIGACRMNGVEPYANEDRGCNLIAVLASEQGAAIR